MSEQNQTPPAEEKKEQDTPEVNKNEDKESETPESSKEIVQIEKEELDKLNSLRDRQAELTRREQRLKKREERLAGSKSRTRKNQSDSELDNDQRFSFEEPEEDEADSGKFNATEEIEFVRLKGLVSDTLIDNEDYQELIKNDSTLRQILRKDPLVLLNETPIDATDAFEQIQEYLDKRVEQYKKSIKKEDKKTGYEKEEDTPTPPPRQPERKEQSKDTAQKTFGEISKGLESKLKGVFGREE